MPKVIVDGVEIEVPQGATMKHCRDQDEAPDDRDS